mgnify:CR=1 FL=1
MPGCAHHLRFVTEHAMWMMLTGDIVSPSTSLPYRFPRHHTSFQPTVSIHERLVAISPNLSGLFRSQLVIHMLMTPPTWQGSSEHTVFSCILRADLKFGALPAWLLAKNANGALGGAPQLA